MKHTPTKYIALLASVALLAAATPAHAIAPAAPAHVEAKPGEVANIGDLAVVVLGWDEIEPGDFSKPDEGNKFISVETIIVNVGDEPASLSSLGQATLRDEESQEYDHSLSASMASNQPQIGGVLLPGERLRGFVGFEVPTAIKSMEYRFVPELFGSDDELRVALDTEPGMVEAPDEIEGETAPETSKAGTAVKSGDFTITLNSAKVVKPSFLKPEKGNQYIVLDVTVTNDSKKKQPLSTALQMNVKDDAGYRYGVSLGASTASKGKTPDGDLAAGDKIKGQVGFEVPIAAKGLTFEFVGDLFNNDKVLIELPAIK